MTGLDFFPVNLPVLQNQTTCIFLTAYGFYDITTNSGSEVILWSEFLIIFCEVLAF